MSKKGRGLLIGAPLVVVLLAVISGFFATQPEDRMSRLRELDLPADGPKLFATLLREIPEVVAAVPCVCCDKVLADCYRGACPPS